MQDYKKILENETTLDPQDWSEMRQLAHNMVDDMMNYLETVGERAAWQPMPQTAKDAIHQPLPEQPDTLDNIYNGFKTNILPYTKGNIHPRFTAWVQGTGTPLAMMADMLASGMNPNTTIGEHSAMYVDKQVIDWCKSLMGFPADASGMLVSGGSIANITGIIVARNSYGNIREAGVQGQAKKMIMYCSSETHSCVMKAAEVTGIGSDNVRKVNIDAHFRMQIAHLEELIAKDKAEGNLPFCIVANAGTVNTGAIDPMNEILAICKRENIWFHIDGAFGALAKLAPEYHDTLKALEEADSVAFDLHKWMYMPYEVGCVLFKNPTLHRAAFGGQPSYLLSHERGIAAGPDPLTNYGMELSRGFKALKVYLSLQHHGAQAFRDLIRQNIAQSFYLGDLISQQPDLELVAPVSMNVVCFRYAPKGIAETALNDLNKNILMELHERGLHVPSSTILHGKYVIRCANVNHRLRKTDYDALVEDVLRIGRELE
jgi:aromatic-L-amino-acid/L-tryptophan decarboxylase